MIYTHKEIILPETLELLKQLQNDPFLEDYFLVGGTSLALQIGHRLSIDIDFEIEKPILTRKISFNEVKKRLLQASKSPNTIF